MFTISRKTCGTERDGAAFLTFDCGAARTFWIAESEMKEEEKIVSCVDQEDDKVYRKLQSALGAHVPGFLSSDKMAFIDKFRSRFEAEIRGKEIIVVYWVKPV